MNATRSAAISGAEAASPCDPEAGADLYDFAADDDSEAAATPDSEGAAGRGARAGLAAELTDERLIACIAGIVERDARALTALYDATLSRVYGLVLRIVRRPALAEEVVEDTFFQVWRQGLRFDAEKGRPMTWLLGMARSRAIDALRRESRFQHDSLDPESMPERGDGGAASDDLLDAARGHAELHRALMLLNAQPRQLVALAFFRGLSHEEIANETALPLGTVKSQIRRALITLRQVLDESARPAWVS